MLADSQHRTSPTSASAPCYLGLSFPLNLLCKQRGVENKFPVTQPNPVPVTFQLDSHLEKQEENFYHWNCWAGSNLSWCPGDIWAAVIFFFVVFKYDFEAARFSVPHLLLILAAECFMTGSRPAWIRNRRSIGCLRCRAVFRWLTRFLSNTTTTPNPFLSTSRSNPELFPGVSLERFHLWCYCLFDVHPKRLDTQLPCDFSCYQHN